MGFGDFGNKEDKETQYHGGFLYILRLDKLLAGLDQITIERDLEKDRLTVLKKNFYLLKALYKEIVSKMNDEEKERQEMVEGLATREYRRAIISHNKSNTFRENIWDFFDCWEIELREIVERTGLLMPDKDDAGGL